MRNMSFTLTIPQFKNQTKNVTRRIGWGFLVPGNKLMGCEKCQGIKKGGLVRLGIIQVVSVRIEPLSAITIDDVIAEGFPDMTPNEFVLMFCEHMKCTPETTVNRIEFRYLKSEFNQL